jgi:hyperosmotically inducible protein
MNENSESHRRSRIFTPRSHVMKNRLTAAMAAILVASLGASAYAQAAQTTPPAPATAPSTTAPSTTNSDQSSQSMPSGTTSSDASKIEQKIKHALTAHGVTATHVTVQFQDGTATLSGTVANQKDVTKAKKAAMRVRGVKHVDTSGLQAQAQGGAGQGVD